MKPRLLFALLSTSAIVVLMSSQGCNEAQQCVDAGECTTTATGAGSSVGGSGQGAGGSGQGGSGGGGVDPGCIPSEAGDPVADTCGVFVSSSLGDDDSGDGTKDAPYATIVVAAATGNNVYACAETFDETAGVALAGGQSLFGGLDCADGWKHGETKTALNGPVDTIALAVSGDGSCRVEDMAVTAANAEQEGGSSIAVLVDGSTLAFARCDLTAGDAADGANGEGLAPDAALDGGDAEDGKNDAATCNMTGNPGAAGGTKTCAAIDVAGGMGGSAFTEPGGSGADGQPEALPGGKGGDGQDPPTGCVTGGQGDGGAEGQPGASGAGLGTLDASGYKGADGVGGTDGAPGQGGGGGGASSCTGSNPTGPSGGGGGSGGCGGSAASAPTAGGSSIALASIGANVTLADSTLTSGLGGAGGNGAAGQNGGFGGNGGDKGANGACDGGDGGLGGKGGPSGGAAGGHSVAVAYVGTVPTGGTRAPGTLGSGGTGGDNLTGTVANDGADGQACQTLDFDNETCE